MSIAEQSQLTLFDIDIFPCPDNNVVLEWKKRLTAKAVLFNDRGEIALIANKINEYMLLPGGGIDEGETPEEGVKRECHEETGCIIDIFENLGVTDDYRSRESKHCVTFGYMARVTGNEMPSLTDREKDIGVRVHWMPISEAVNFFKAQKASLMEKNIAYYNTGFNIVRDHFYIEKAMTVLSAKKMPR